MVIVATSTLLLATAGCGSVGDREAAARDTAVRMLTAAAGDDGAGACALLAPETAAAVEQSAGASCAEAILDEDLPTPGSVTATQVYGQWAQVRLSGDTVFLAAFPGGWRVVAAGCEQRPERPYRCTVEGG
jgi:hypothetical protein